MPTFTFVTSNQTVLSTQQTSLLCEAMGNPLPILSWVRHHQVVLSSSSVALQNGFNPTTAYHIDVDGNARELDSNELAVANESNVQGIVRHSTSNQISIELFHNKEANNFQNELFTCFATNAMGSVKRTVFVEIVSVPAFKNQFANSSKHEIFIGFPLTLTCDATGKPNPQIIWQQVFIHDCVCRHPKMS